MKIENLKRAGELSKQLAKNKQKVSTDAYEGLRSLLSGVIMDYLEVQTLPNRFKSGIDELIVAASVEITDRINDIEKEAESL